MRKIKHSFAFLLIIVSVSCKKDSVNHTPNPEYQETRSARITQIELTDKDFRQYFVYGVDGFLDSVKREGADIGDFSNPNNLLSISHYTDHIKVNTIHDYDGMGIWMNVKFFTLNQKITGTQFSMKPFPAPEIYSFLKINYSNDGYINTTEAGSAAGSEPEYYPFITNIMFDGNKFSQFKVVNPQSYLMLEFLNHADYDVTFSYSKNALISPSIIKLVNNALVQFINAGEFVDGWENLVYGFTGYELPVQEKDELISQIRYKAYLKEDGSLHQDSTVTFNYRVDTLNKKISFGNQIITYEFVD